jgi:hypothetical protein
MTPGTGTPTAKIRRADIARLVVCGGADVCVTRQAQKRNLIIGAEIRSGPVSDSNFRWSLPRKC